ncbi:F0F1 ATP synthase subunit epsilon [Nigerium massiliense]|uniref:F0F1 ATP synthase subunit epsilon n=1 Tax=Nigerium massiliense TaxID=1522317 RepID=UPI00058C7A22|nr:F0F1 ATP synthase subunit epsilon [Nigerium massiliense]
MADDALHVEVVSATGSEWEGEAVQVITRTIDGDIGILPRHAPLLAALVPSATEIVTQDGKREVVAVDGGFISVEDNHVAVIAQYAEVAREISEDVAQRELAAAVKLLEEGDNSEETRRRYNMASAQVKAANKASGQGH